MYKLAVGSMFHDHFSFSRAVRVVFERGAVFLLMNRRLSSVRMVKSPAAGPFVVDGAHGFMPTAVFCRALLLPIESRRRCRQQRGGAKNGTRMVQKWAIGAMINISGSIAINLGTNLMKLSHKVRRNCSPEQATSLRVLYVSRAG